MWMCHTYIAYHIYLSNTTACKGNVQSSVSLFLWNFANNTVCPCHIYGNSQLAGLSYISFGWFRSGIGFKSNVETCWDPMSAWGTLVQIYLRQKKGMVSCFEWTTQSGATFCSSRFREGNHPDSTRYLWGVVILLMAEILHQFIGSLSHYL